MCLNSKKPFKINFHFNILCEMSILQLPIRTGLHTTQSIQNVEQNKECLINVSKHKFSLVINGLTKTLQSVDSMVRQVYLTVL